MGNPPFDTVAEGREMLENLLHVINERVKPRQRMSVGDIGKLIQGGPQELETELAHEIGNVLICGHYLGTTILP